MASFTDLTISELVQSATATGSFIRVGFSGADFTTDGDSDDETIQEAIDVAFALGGGVVCILPSPNTYDITNEIYIRNKVIVVGHESATVLRVTDNANCKVFRNPLTGSSSHIGVSDLTIDGNKANNSTGQMGVRFVGVSYFSIKNLTVFNTKTSGIECTTTCYEGVVEGNHVYGTGTDNGINVTHGSYNIVTRRNTVHNCGQSGIECDPNTIGSVDIPKRLIFTENYCYDNAEAGINIDKQIAGAEVEGVDINYGSVECTVSNNICYGNGDSGIDCQIKVDKINISNNQCYRNAHGISIRSSRDMIVTGNHCIDNIGRGINGGYQSEASALVEGHEFIISNNICSNYESSDQLIGIWLDGWRDGIVTGNICKGNAENGMRTNSPCTNVEIMGNKFTENLLDGLYLSKMMYGGVSHNTVRRNGRNGMNILSTQYTDISNNKAVDNSQSSPDTYVNIQISDSFGSLGQYSLYNIISENICTDTKTGTDRTARWGLRIQGASNVSNKVFGNTCLNNRTGQMSIVAGNTLDHNTTS